MDWNELLKNLSFVISTRLEENMIYFDRGKIKDSWLGYPPASEKAIKAKEKELNISFPTSYKDFLRVTNGFKQISHFAGHLLPVEKIDFLKKIDSDLYHVYVNEQNEDISDSRYSDYSKKQGSEFFRIDHLLTSIAISKNVDGSIILLNPKVTFGDECEAWIYASWYPGAIRFKSFKDLIEEAYKSTVELLNKKQAPRQ